MADIEQLSKQLGSDDQVKVYQARQGLAKLVGELGMPGQAQQRAEAAKTMAALLTAGRESKDSKTNKVTTVPELSAKARNEICRYLASLAGDSEVAAYAEALQDFEVREMARWALSRMASPAATEALAKAATDGIGNEFRVGAINALGCKPGSATLVALKASAGDQSEIYVESKIYRLILPALKTCAADPTPEIRLAAAEALANFSDPANDEVIRKANPGFGRPAKRVAKARLRLAANLVSAGQKDAAKRIYEDIGAGKFDAAQKKAAKAALAGLG